MHIKKEIQIGNVIIGGHHPIAIQSMTNTKTSDYVATSNQINALSKMGATIVRVTIMNEEDAKALPKIIQRVHVPIVADIHFDYRLALMAIENGASKIRINPGNIGSKENVEKIVNSCKTKHIPIRIGINSGSLEKDLYEKYGGATPQALYESMKRNVNLLESFGFYDIVLSIKSTDIMTTIQTNELLFDHFDYPIHIGLTESGTIHSGTIRSSYTLGTLLQKGIGNTIRVSLTGNPEVEIPVAKEILSMFHLYNKPTLISCPTCGRTQYHMEDIVKEMEAYLNTLHSSIKVAIMGCAVNGPGEAKDADIGIAGGIGEAILFKKGKIICKVTEDKIIETLKEEIEKMCGN